MTVLDNRTALGKPVVTNGIIDVDIHPSPPPGALNAYLSSRWRKHLADYGTRTYAGRTGAGEYPPLYAASMRADAWPEEGFPGSDLGLIQKQVLDAFDVQLGVLQALGVPMQLLNQDFAAAMCRATTDWQLEHLVYPEPRLRAAMPIPFESPDLAVAEIHRIGGDPGVAAVLMLSKSLRPFGNRHYWPIYQAAVDHGLPIQVHLSQGGGHANTGSGWTSYHVEYHTGHTQSFQSQLCSLIFEGTFDRFPDLKIVFVEGNVAHFAPLMQRMDYHWETLRSEVPDLQRKPSEYIADHIWASTQPIDEPDNPEHLVQMIEEFGTGNVLFASDYPHFDFDSAAAAFPRRFPTDLLAKIMRGNGQRVFGLEDVLA
ncbi:amidohydrolase [Nocardia salmonicida]|uniref:Amidohydrolase n=1 Tax=Nocardia salmonicida TaxID=53431 RepID=A0ABZ1N3B2_9NOCA